MKKFIITITLLILLAGSVFSAEWKKVAFDCVSCTEDEYSWILDMTDHQMTKKPNDDTKIIYSVSEWIPNQVVIEVYKMDYSKDIEKERKATEITAAAIYLSRTISNSLSNISSNYYY